MQGDVTAIYRNSDSRLIGTYEYDPWGKPVSVKEASTGIDTQGVLTRNPFRYRGYYYDTETGFYNLNARYYDPQVRRFISPDNLIADVGTSVQGHNLFVYCFNDSVNMADPSGYWPLSAKNCIKQTAKNIIKPTIDFIQGEISNVNATYSDGYNVSFTPSIWVFDIMVGKCIDTKGNIALQGSFTGGVTGGLPNLSFTGYESITNAPSIDSLSGLGYQLGGTIGVPIYGVPVAVGGDFNIIEDKKSNKLYFGRTSNIGFGTTGGEFHAEWGKTAVSDRFRFNVFNASEWIYNKIMDW